jgi:aminoglycoside phosphotransferase (APT) family kinase protein
LRGHPHPGQLEREHYVFGIMHERTRVPAPWPYLVDERTDIFGWPYAIMPRMRGLQLADGDVRKEFTEEDKTAIVAALADCLADLHEPAFDFVGVYDANSHAYAPAGKSYADWFGDWTRWWLDLCRKASANTTDGDVAWVESILVDAHEALARPFPPALVHTDFKEGNAVAERCEVERWCITGIFDVAETYLGDGEYDLARAYCEYLPRHPDLAGVYLHRYLMRRPPRPGFRERFRHYLLHDRLILWEYGQRIGIWFRPGQPLREWAEPFLRVVDH